MFKKLALGLELDCSVHFFKVLIYEPFALHSKHADSKTR